MEDRDPIRLLLQPARILVVALLLLIGAQDATANGEAADPRPVQRRSTIVWLLGALAGGVVIGAGLQASRARRGARLAESIAKTLQADLAVRKKTEEALKEEMERVNAVLDTTADAIVTADKQGIILSCNRATERIFGYAADELRGRNVGLLMPSPHKEQHDAYIARYLSTGQSRIIGVGREVLALRKDGTRVPVDLALSDAEVNGEHLFTAVIRDIRDRKNLEARLVAASEQVRQEIGQELHDALGQELTGISLLAKTLDRQLAARQDELKENAAAVSDLARQAVEQVRMLSHGLYPVNLRRLGLGGALQELAEGIAHRLGISCPLSLDEKADPPQEDVALHFYRIAQEATNNAIRHAKATRIAIDLRSDGEQIELCVEDNGPGLPSPPTEAAGMGLSIMAYRASLLGATIEFRSGAEGGLTVVCRRPVETKGR